jgi:Na+/H+ antiporter NhaD/arsenite permease-like protein
MQNPTPQDSLLKTVIKLMIMTAVVATTGVGTYFSGIAPNMLAQFSVCTFIGVICTTLFFWPHRVAVAFLGIAILIGSQAMTLRGLLQATELDIIFFLIGMMIIVGALKDLGVLTWVIQIIINQKHMTGMMFVIVLCILSAILSSVIGEVSSIVVVLALIFQVCETLKVRATPFVLMSVLSTNIGSAATMLGNPVGIFIGNKAGFTFSQFLLGATPIAIAALLVTMITFLFFYHKDIRDMTEQMELHRLHNQGLGPLLRIPHRRGLFVLAATIGIIVFHHQIEKFLGLMGADNKNAFLIVTPLVIAGILMMYRPQRARYYVEHDVEWWTLLFFMLLFAIAGSMEEQNVTRNLADKLMGLVKGGPDAMVPFVLVLSSLGSAFVDNIVFVAAFTPVIQALVERSADYTVLWWTLLFGACFGGNITAVGSTANIIALGFLEKRAHAHIGFREWLKIGTVVGLITGLVAWGLLMVLPVQQPLSHQKVPVKQEAFENMPLHEPILSPAK